MKRDPCIIRAWLASPLAGDAPMLDAILEYHAFSHNIDGCEALSAGYCGQLHKHDPVTYDMLDCVPLARHKFLCGEMCYCVSSPIVDCVHEKGRHLSSSFPASKKTFSASILAAHVSRAYRSALV